MSKPARILKYFDGAGKEIIFNFPVTKETHTYYLPKIVDDHPRILSEASKTSSPIRLDVDEHHVLLSIWSEIPDQCYVLGNNDEKVFLPASTPKHQKSIILSHRSRFVTSAGNWLLLFAPCSPKAEDQKMSTDAFNENSTTASSSPSSQGNENFALKSSDFSDRNTEDEEESLRRPNLLAAEVVTLTTDDRKRRTTRSESKLMVGVEKSTLSSIESMGTKEIERDNIHSKRVIQHKASATEDETSKRDFLNEATKKRKSPTKSYSHRKRTMLEIDDDVFQKTSLKQETNHTSKISSNTHGIGKPRMSDNGQQGSGCSSEVSQLRDRSVRDRAKVSDNCHSMSVIFSSDCSVQNTKKIMSGFTDRGGRIVDSIHEADVMCVSSGPLKKTCKFIMAVVLDRPIVTETWIHECHRQGKWLDFSRFQPKDKDRPKEWESNPEKISSSNVVVKRSQLLRGVNVYLTPQLKKELGEQVIELYDVATAMGAEDLQPKLPTMKDSGSTKILVLGTTGDSHCAEVVKLGLPLYTKEIITKSALRGYIDLGSEEFEVLTSDRKK